MAKTVLGRALSVCATRFMRPHRDFFRRIQSEGGQVRLLREMNTLGVPIDFEFAPA
jgi:hypothetical protein